MPTVLTTVSGREAFQKAIADSGISVAFYNNPTEFEGHVVEALALVEPHLKIVITFQENVCTGAADGYARMTGNPAIAVVNHITGLQSSLANQHNAKRAGSPMLTLVAEDTNFIFSRPPPGETELPGSETLAGTVARYVVSPASPLSLEADLNRAIASLSVPAEPSQSRIATCVLPEKLEWSSVVVTEDRQTVAPPFPIRPTFASVAGDPAVTAQLEGIASALMTHGKETAMLLAGAALVQPCLGLFGAVAQATGCRLLGINLFSRIDRGQGNPAVERMPYFPDAALKLLTGFKAIVLCDAPSPVAQFGYEDGISSCYPEGVPKHEIVYPDMDAAVAKLLTLLPRLAPGTPLPALKPPPSVKPAAGKLTPVKMCSMIAMLQPANAIVVDESLTSGGTYYDAAEGCPAFSHLCLTGGAIGQGMPCATGAAIACPSRKVINIQADGSALYTSQALYTQTIEKLDVVTVICANDTYQILRVEQRKQGLKTDTDRLPPGLSEEEQRAAFRKNLTSLQNPTIKWEMISKSYGVPATTATTVDEFYDQFAAAVERVGVGPCLIVAKL